MKKQLMLLLFVLCALISKAQLKTETYYKDYYLTKKVDEKKAKFKKTETKSTDGTVNIQIFDLSKNCVLREENYRDDKAVGVWSSFSENCSLIKKRDFSKLKYASQQTDSLFDNVIREGNPGNYEKAQYGESENALFQYLVAKLSYPVEAKEQGISGTVYLKFIIKADGSIQMVRIARSADAFLDYEAWDLIENMPKWNPAKKNGHPIDSYYTFPMRFTLK